MKFNELYEITILEKKIIGQKARIVTGGVDLGKDFPFKDGDIVKITKFIGYSLGHKEFRIQALKGQEWGILTDEMLEVI